MSDEPLPGIDRVRRPAHVAIMFEAVDAEYAGTMRPA